MLAGRVIAFVISAVRFRSEFVEGVHFESELRWDAPALEQVVVFLEESVEGLPDVGVHFRDDVAHLLPKPTC